MPTSDFRFFPNETFIMTESRLNYVTCPDALPAADGASPGTHKMAYWQWGRDDAEHLLVCVHGLSRQGRDFDVLAKALLAEAESRGQALKIVCPDVVGRGESDWLANPRGYEVPFYVADMVAMLTALKPKTLDWLGTSMGGLIGISLTGAGALPPELVPPAMKAALAALPPVRKLILNDVGPAIAWVSLERIGSYLGQNMRFDSLEQAAEGLRLISAGFGPHTKEQWLELSRHMVKPDAQKGGKAVVLHYDPAIAIPFKSTTKEASEQGSALLWHLYDHIAARTLVLRGKDSDLLTVETAQAMTQRGPKAKLVEFAGVGHAPTLIADDQVKAVKDFLFA
jgi:pimeloyl-ACP methyl ester carboxylesterase